MDLGALIRELAGVQNLAPAGDLETVLKQLGAPLEQYTELEFRSDHKRIDLVTLHRETSQVRAFLDVLQARGNDDLTMPEALLRFATGKVMGMKLPVAGSVAGGELYARGAIPLKEVQFFLKQRGITAQIDPLAALFQKQHTHMVAVDAAMPPRVTVFFTQYLTDENTGEKTLLEALKAVGIDTEQALSQVEAVHEVLSMNRPKTLFFSWGFTEGRAKIDYVDARVGMVAEVLEMTGLRDSIPALMRWSEVLGRSKINYTGLIVTPAGITDLRAYFTVKSSTYKLTV